MSTAQRYKAVLDTVKGIFDSNGIILTGSAVDVISGANQNLQSRKFVLYTDGENTVYMAQEFPKDLDLLIVTGMPHAAISSYLSGKARRLEKELAPEDRLLLDMAVCDSYFPETLSRLKELAGHYEAAQSEGKRVLAAQMRNSRSSVINRDMRQAGSLYVVSQGNFVNCFNVPLCYAPYSHTTSLAGGRDRIWVNNQQACEAVLQASRMAYLPEELAETYMEAEAQRKLKNSGIQRISPEHMQVFMTLAREHGWRKSEEKQERRVKGMWDVSLPEDFAQGARNYLRKESPELFSILESLESDDAITRL